MVVYASLDETVNSRSFSSKNMQVVEVLNDVGMHFQGILEMLGALAKNIVYEVALTGI